VGEREKKPDTGKRGNGETGRKKAVPSERIGVPGYRGIGVSGKNLEPGTWNLELGIPARGWRHSGRSVVKTRNPGKSFNAEGRRSAIPGRIAESRRGNRNSGGNSSFYKSGKCSLSQGRRERRKRLNSLVRRGHYSHRHSGRSGLSRHSSKGATTEAETRNPGKSS